MYIHALADCPLMMNLKSSNQTIVTVHCHLSAVSECGLAVF